MASLSYSVAALVALLSCCAFAQSPFSVIPTVSEAVKENAVRAGAAAFIRLWEYGLEVDGQGPGPAVRINFEAKTILAPGAVAMINLIPQDVGDPLYGNTKELTTLRRTFIKDHLVLDPIKPTHPNLTKEGGVRALTFSGKDVHIKKDAGGKLSVEGIAVSETMSLKDGTQVYILEDILFDNRQKVNDVFKARFSSELEKPAGPPLEIVIPAFVPSPQLNVSPGSPGSTTSLGFSSGFVPVLPPAPPSGSSPAVIRAHAPPPSFLEPQPPAPPPSVGVNGGLLPPPLPPSVRAPAPPPPSFRAPAPPPGFPRAQFSGPPSPPSPPAPPVSDDSIIFPEANPGKRNKRQLSFPDADNLGTLDPVLRGDSSDLTLPENSPFNPSPSPRDNGYLRLPTTHSNTRPTGSNRPLSELSSIEQFATLFQLSGSPDGSSVVGVLQRAGLVTMLGLLETSGLLQHLVSGEKGPFILMVPSESAFSKLSRQDLYDLTRGKDLSYHMIPLQGQQPAPEEVVNDSTFVTLLGPKLRFNVYGGVTYANGVPVTRSDLTFSYGTIQVVESVLLPPVGDLQGVLVNRGRSLSRINTLLTVVGSFDQGAYTLLAPPDSAISSKGYSWPGLLMQRALGKDLLHKHMFEGTWYSEGLLEERTMKTLAGTSVTFRKDLDGTMTANGVPMRSCNLSATNGVVHLVADVIPDSDLGSDPTAIPNPLVTQTESPQFESFTSGGNIVTTAPAISRLYEFPDRNPFQEFIPISSKSTKPPNTQRSGFPLPDSQPPKAELYINQSENGQNLFSTAQVFNNIQTRSNSNNFDQDGPTGPVIPGSLGLNNEEFNPELISFLEMLDKTADDYRDGSLPIQEPLSPSSGSDYTRLPGTNIANDVVKPLPSKDQSVPEVTNEDSYYGQGIIIDITESPFSPDIQENTPTPAFDSMIKRRPAISPNIIIVVDPTSQPATDTSVPTVESEILTILGSTDFTGNYTADLQFTTGSSALLGDIYRPDFEMTIKKNPTVAVVPEGPWATESSMPDDGRKWSNAVSLLQQLNLTRFAELLEISGLTRILNFDGPWTVFAPSNKAIEAIPEAALQEMITHPRFLRRVMSYHLAPGKFPSRDFCPGIHIPTLHAGYTLVISYYTDGPVSRWVASGGVITDLDEEATNGVIHVLDQMLYAPYGHLITTISLSPLLTIFSSILASDRDIQTYLSGPGPFTIFAPSDGSLRNLTIPVDPAIRRAWILSHTMEGTWYTAGFSNTWPLVSYNNDTLVTNISSDSEKITVNEAQVTYADVTASNGVLHVIESPLFSPT